jgi:hypothetical protein
MIDIDKNVPHEGSKNIRFCVVILSLLKHLLEAYHVPIQTPAHRHHQTPINQVLPIWHKPQINNSKNHYYYNTFIQRESQLTLVATFFIFYFYFQSLDCNL